MFGFLAQEKGNGLQTWYPNVPRDSLWATWFSFLKKYRIPADQPYLNPGDRPLDEYIALAETGGAKHLNLLEIENPPSGMTIQNYTKTVIEALAPMVANLTARGLGDRLTVYGE